MRPWWPLSEERVMFGVAASRFRRIGLAAIAGLNLAAALSAAPARAELDLSIAIPGVTYYTPPPAFAYDSSHWYQPVMGGVYLGFGNYHHHYW
jgi:hypothetical protein